jgi:hypothetical protein
MNAYNAEDGRKYNYALLARDIRRLTATIHRADIDGGTRELIDTALEQLEGRIRRAPPARGRMSKTTESTAVQPQRKLREHAHVMRSADF